MIFMTDWHGCIFCSLIIGGPNWCMAPLAKYWGEGGRAPSGTPGSTPLQYQATICNFDWHRDHVCAYIYVSTQSVVTHNINFIWNSYSRMPATNQHYHHQQLKCRDLPVQQPKISTTGHSVHIHVSTPSTALTTKPMYMNASVQQARGY